MIDLLREKLPPEVRALDEAQGQSKDYEFSQATMEARWVQGRADALATLRAAPWLAPAPSEVDVRTFDVLQPSRLPAVSQF